MKKFLLLTSFALIASFDQNNTPSKCKTDCDLESRRWQGWTATTTANCTLACYSEQRINKQFVMKNWRDKQKELGDISKWD
jgi:hypothetical protein